MASNIDIAPTIPKPAASTRPGDVRAGPAAKALAERNRIVDVYWDNIQVDALHNLDSDLIARVVVDGWDKLIVRPDSMEFYDLKNDPDDRNDLAARHPDKVKKLSALMDNWLDATPIVFPKARTTEGRSDIEND